MSALNPFPDYAVTPLKGDTASVRERTFVTEAIRLERAVADAYAYQWFPAHANKPAAAAVVGVRGDYGAGKTHLLLDAAGCLQERLFSTYPDLFLKRIACQETDVVSWFRSNVGPELKGSPTATAEMPGAIERLMLRLYAHAAETIAGNLKLTDPAVQRLRDDPEVVRKLVKENLLNASLVDQEFARLLKQTAPNAGENVRRALAGTIWADTSGISLRWLAGERLDAGEKAAIRVPDSLSSEEDAAGVLVALASVHDRLGIPFVLMFDELEHLKRYDDARRGKRNITWLKRLLEDLARCPALTFISGHWSAWEGQQDYLDRLSALRPIDLTRVSGSDVLAIVRARVPALSSSFGTVEAEAIAEGAGGNIRRVLTLCRVLFTESDGFVTLLTGEAIQNAAAKLGNRIAPEEVLGQLRNLLAGEGLVFAVNGVTQKEPAFDLIAYEQGRARVVVAVKHAVHRVELFDQAKVFLDRVEVAHQSAADIIACFVVDGNVDDELLELLRATRPFKLLWHDLSKPDAMSTIARDLRSALHDDAGVGSGDERGAKLAAQRAKDLVSDLGAQITAASSATNAGLVRELEKQRELVASQLAVLNEGIAQRENALRAEVLQSLKSQVDQLDRRRSEELNAIYARIANVGADRPLREREVIGKQTDEDSPRLNATYADLTRPMSLNAKLRLALRGTWLFVYFAAFAFSILLLLSAGELAGLFAYSQRQYSLYKAAFTAYSIIVFIAVLFMFWQRVSRVDAFLEYSARVLREIYIRNESVQALMRADFILRDAVESQGLLSWKAAAESRLSKEFGSILGGMTANGSRLR
ncbi:MAG TPA: BREX system ATP-binding domain-containing protein [Vicinamibacterales bacterium]|jgi:hypothetical protein|nr:BREX system ATP-binding domain-containing protein [Vicinamibacterales bacterium]